MIKLLERDCPAGCEPPRFRYVMDLSITPGATESGCLRFALMHAGEKGLPVGRLYVDFGNGLSPAKLINRICRLMKENEG